MESSDNRKIKVLMINHEFPPIGGGGGTTTRFLAKYLTKLGVEVNILTAKPAKELVFNHPDGFRIYYTGPTKINYETSHIPEMARFIFNILFSAKKMINIIKPDLIHCFFSIPAGCFGLYAKKAFNIPYITSALGADVPGFNIGDWRLNVYHAVTHNSSKAIWTNSSFVIANSPSLRLLCEKFLPNQKIEMITNGVDTDVFYPPVAKRNLQNEAVQILFVSRLSPQKGVETLIKTCGILKKRGVNNFRLTIVGDGPLKNKMFSMINKFKLGDKVDFLGWRKLEELPSLYRNSDIFFLPSVMEGMSSVVLQAMACGLPIIASKVEGFEEVLKENVNGLTAIYNDAHGFADALEKLIRLPELREKMSRKSFEKSKQFSWEKVAERYFIFYEKAVYSKKAEKQELLLHQMN